MYDMTERGLKSEGRVEPDSEGVWVEGIGSQ